MRKYLALLVCIVAVSPLGCGTLKKVIGWGDEAESAPPKKNPPKKIIVPPSKPVKITSTTLSNWALYSLITLTVLFGVKYLINKQK